MARAELALLHMASSPPLLLARSPFSIFACSDAFINANGTASKCLGRQAQAFRGRRRWSRLPEVRALRCSSAHDSPGGCTCVRGGAHASPACQGTHEKKKRKYDARSSPSLRGTGFQHSARHGGVACIVFDRTVLIPHSFGPFRCRSQCREHGMAGDNFKRDSSTPCESAVVYAMMMVAGELR